LDEGIISEVDVSQAEAEYQDALARIPEIELAIARAENALSVLLGQQSRRNSPGPPHRRVAPAGVPSGLPSELLERRPDIRAAEQALIAANAQIGVANRCISRPFP
jgi:outer membrane protein, multidrug efflux system